MSVTHAGASEPRGAMPASRATVPGRVLVAWRVFLMILMVTYATLATEVVRGLVGGFGLHVESVVVIVVSTMIAMLAFLPLGAVIDLPEAIWEYWLPDRRWKQGRCPCCGYDANRARCPECGTPFARPPSYATDLRTLRRTTLVVVPSWIIGLAAGLVMVNADESAFQREVAALRASEPELRDHARRRAWPADFAELTWNAGRGFVGPPPFDSPKTAR